MKKSSIAIIGMACIAPGAHNPEELWQNILAGRRYFRKAPDERLPRKWYYDPNPEAPGKTYCDQMAVITNWEFDPFKYKIAPITQNASDMAHWMALDTAAQLFERLNLDLDAIDKNRVGIILGNSLAGEFSRSHNIALRLPYLQRALEEYLKLNKFSQGQAEQFVASFLEYFKAPLPEPNEDTLSGNMSNVIAGRIAYNFDFGAGAYAIDGACSSSLLSVVHACNALRNSDMDLAVAGGVDISLDPFEIVGFAKTKALTKTDIKPYDKNADGMLPGEGCGLLLLEKEEDARKNGHYIYALLKGWGYSSDGRSGGITAPKVEGQMRALENTYKIAGYPISSVKLFEGHGTGTPVGDAVELECMKRLLDKDGSENVSRIGSIKSNIGHCKAAAGAMGIIKATMALNRKILPPTTNCSEPSPVFGAPLSNFEPAIKPEFWESNGHPRRASVSGMGFGGSNGHVTLEEANPEEQPSPEDQQLFFSAQKTELILLDADTIEDLKDKVKNLIPVANRICRAELTDLSAALSAKVEHKKFRLALVAESPWNLHDLLTNIHRWLDENRAIDEINNPSEGIFIAEAKENVRIAGLFPGQGSHFINMGEQLKDRHNFIDELYKAADDSVSDIFPDALSKRIFTNIFRLSAEQLKSFENTLKNTGTAQPAIVLSSMAMMKMLEFFGIHPHVCLGHSLGEISAMAAAGFFDELAAVKIAALRGKSKTDLKIDDPGAMAATVAPSEKVDEMLATFKDEIIAVANYNSPSQTVVSGSTQAVERFVALSKEKGFSCRLLPVSHAFHSDIVAPAALAFEQFLNEMNLSKHVQDEKSLSLFISTATGDYLDKDADIIQLLSEHIRKPVRFIEAVEKATESKPDLWIEIGPGGILSGLVKAITGNDTLCLASNIKGEELFSSLNYMLAQCFVSGVNIKAERLFDSRFYRALDPDNYNPLFITNPCERKVNIEELDLKQTSMIGSGLLPENEGVTQYLEHRKDYLKEMIELDFRHFNPEGVKIPSGEKVAILSLAPEQPEQKEKTNTDYIDFAIKWISKRTGIPTDRIKPEMRLRDDLNLDSIRAGELVIMLSKEMKAVRTVDDPAIFANARITDIVDQVGINAKKEADTAHLVKEQINVVDDSITSQHWVNTFHIERMEHPLTNEAFEPIKANSKLTIVCDTDEFPAEVLAGLFRQKEIDVQLVAWDKASDLNNHPESLLLILPKEKAAFFEQSPQEFLQISKSTLSNVFGILKNCIDGSGSFPDGFRCMIIDRFDENEKSNTTSLAFHAFLKSLKLEHKAARFKMLSLPAKLENQHEVIVSELEHFSERIRIEYTGDKRFTCVAAPITEAGNQSLSLSAEDVIVVSGGGKGITFQHALALGRNFGVKLALLGTSSLPSGGKDKSNELAENLKLLENEKITFTYLQCDVTNPESVQQVFMEAEKQLGTVTGIFHGAGISRFNLFRDKSFDEFFECYKVKAYGLCNLLHACNPGKLKMLHATSSVLGHTGMRSQCDYNYANAWLDSAVQDFGNNYEQIHCLTLSYTIWKETGLGKKMGALDYLQKVGVHSLSIEEGVSSYLHLLRHINKKGNFVITGRLSNELESNLYAPLVKMNGRFLEKVLRFVPQTEIVTECTLSHETDLYLPEHVYNGTPVMPAVMEIEAIVQNVLQCMGAVHIPVLKNIRFKTPVIVPKGEKVKIRIFSTADHRPAQSPVFQVLIKTGIDDFEKNYIEAECLFENEIIHPDELPVCPELGEPLQVNPNELSPYPLFQGKLFRRIEKIYKQEFEKDCITTIRVPDNEQYFADGFDREIYFGSPVVRDSAYQSGLLIVSEGSLPDAIQEIRMFKNIIHDNTLIFKLKELVKKNSLEYDVSFTIFNENRELVAYEKISLKKPETNSLHTPAKKIKPISIDRIESDLKSLLPDVKHSIAVVSINSLNVFIEKGELTQEEVAQIKKRCSEARLASTFANLVAARRAAIKFANQYGKHPLNTKDVNIIHQKDGKPLLAITETYPDKAIFADMDISIADGDGYSIAFIGTGKVGVDIEPVEYRDAETWLGLLGRDGYNLALELSDKTFENFDVSATRVWTLIEAGKKGNGLKKEVPKYNSMIGGSWLSFKENYNEFICSHLVEKNRRYCFSATYKNSGNGKNLPQEDIEHFLDNYFKLLTDFRAKSIADPNSKEVENNYNKFQEIINSLKEIELYVKKFSLTKVSEYKMLFQTRLMPFIQDSQIFSHSLLKPLGYAGDFSLLEKLSKNEFNSRGIAYHFDRIQIDYPGTNAVKNRIEWIYNDILNYQNQNNIHKLRILDIGIGAGPIERKLSSLNYDFEAELTGIDFEKKALDFVESELKSSKIHFTPVHLNLRDKRAKDILFEKSNDVDICIAVGILEAFNDSEAIEILRAILAGLPSNSILYTENYLPDHPSRFFMEWYMDFYLGYRTKEQLVGMLKQTGVNITDIQAKTDDTNSLTLIKVIK